MSMYLSDATPDDPLRGQLQDSLAFLCVAPGHDATGVVAVYRAEYAIGLPEDANFSVGVRYEILGVAEVSPTPADASATVHRVVRDLESYPLLAGIFIAIETGAGGAMAYEELRRSLHCSLPLQLEQTRLTYDETPIEATGHLHAATWSQCVARLRALQSKSPPRLIAMEGMEGQRLYEAALRAAEAAQRPTPVAAAIGLAVELADRPNFSLVNRQAPQRKPRRFGFSTGRRGRR